MKGFGGEGRKGKAGTETLRDIERTYRASRIRPMVKIVTARA